ncbi:MAG: ribose 5-phosphate isomerase A [Nitrososphaerota archaeon]
MDRALEAVVKVAVESVKSLGGGVVLGLGSGRTSAAFIKSLAAEEGPRIVEAVIPTSIQSEAAASEAGFRIGSLYNYESIEIYVDSFDQCNVSGDLVKGMGGALAREKLLMRLARSVLLIGTEEKLVEKLSIPVPLEVLSYAAPAIPRLLREKGWNVRVKTSEGKSGPVVTDNGNVLMLVEMGVVNDPPLVERELKMIPGVVEAGIFPNRGYKVIVGMRDGAVREIT